MKLVSKLISVLLLSVVLSSAAASDEAEKLDVVVSSSSSLPAVDGVNAKLSFEHDIDGSDSLGGTGSITIPLGRSFGLQLDGGAANHKNELIGDASGYRGAAHLFWRDPSKGMLGLFGDYIRIDLLDGFNFYAGGVEGAVYFERWTLHGIVGLADGDLVDSSFFDRARLTYYPLDNLSIHIGHAYAHDEHRMLFGSEWGFVGQAGAATSLFLQGDLDEDGDTSMLAGFRLYLGQHDKSLIRRHREDDPPDALGSATDTNYDFLIKYLELGGSGIHPWNVH